MPRYRQIAYTSGGDITKFCYQQRFVGGGGANRKTGKNCAAVCYHGGNIVRAAWSNPAEHKHSEKVLLDLIDDVSTIVWIYTERMPCGHGPGLANCRSLLNKNLKDDTPVYFTAPYYEGDDGEPSAAAVLASAFSTSQTDKRSFVNEAAAVARRRLASSYPMWHEIWATDPLPGYVIAPADQFADMTFF